MKKRLKIDGFLIASAVVSAAVFPSVFMRRQAAGFWEAAAQVFGVSLVVLGQLIRVSARGYKSEHSRNGSLLIQGGPYLAVRNPMYLGILLIGMGLVSVLFQWWVACAFLFIFALRYAPLVRKEEKKLRNLFSRDYAAYQRIPRLIPSPAALFKKNIREYLPLRLPWIKKEIGSIIAVLAGMFLLKAWRDFRF